MRDRDREPCPPSPDPVFYSKPQNRLFMNYDQLQKILLDKGYRFFDAGQFNVNLVGVRSHLSESNRFDDTLYIAYKDERFQKTVKEYSITTDPGKPWLLKPLDPNGCAIIVPGHYPAAYMIGVHGRSHASGGYPALEQVGALRYVRDNNRDAIVDASLWQDPARIFSGILKTNIHHAGKDQLRRTLFRYFVNAWSAGCQVFEYYDDFLEFMDLCKKSAAIHGNSFTYTLLEEKDLK